MFEKSSVRFADLNEPAQLEEATPSPVGLLGYGNIHKETIKSNPAFVVLPREARWNSPSYKA